MGGGGHSCMRPQTRKPSSVTTRTVLKGVHDYKIIQYEVISTRCVLYVWHRLQNKSRCTLASVCVGQSVNALVRKDPSELTIAIGL